MLKVIINEVPVSYFEVEGNGYYSPFNVLLNLKELSDAFGTTYSTVLDILNDRADYMNRTHFENGIPYLPVPCAQGMCMILTAKRGPSFDAITSAYEIIYEEFLQKPGQAYRNQPQFLN